VEENERQLTPARWFRKLVGASAGGKNMPGTAGAADAREGSDNKALSHLQQRLERVAPLLHARLLVKPAGGAGK
jgi:hypothetical protein